MIAPADPRSAPADPRSAFLTAEWRDLAILNFETEPTVLRPFVPGGGPSSTTEKNG
jgi:hypothetical protein